MTDSAAATARRFVLWAPQVDGSVWIGVRAITAALLALVIGMVLEWSLGFVLLLAVVVAAITFASGSLVRALACLVASAAGIAAVLELALAANGGIAMRLHITWTVIVVVWLALAVMLGFGLRRWCDLAPAGSAEIAAAWVSIVTAAAIGRRLDLQASMLGYLVHVEDNEAWVGLTTQIRTMATLGPGFRGTGLGPLTPLLLGLLERMQQPSVPYTNAVFAAYALAVILTPLVVAALIPRVLNERPVIVASFLMVAAGWAVHVPFLLFSNYGHLSATLAFLFALLAIGMFALHRQGAFVAILLGGLSFAVGSTWFPLMPIALLGIAVAANALVPFARSWRVLAAIALLTLFALSLMHQGGEMLGLWSGTGVGGARTALDAMYSSQGGTAMLDGTVQMLVLAGLVGAAFISADAYFVRLWRCCAVGTGYVLLVFAGSYVAKHDPAYGPTKLWFIVGSAVAVVLVALVVRVPMAPRVILASLIVLAIGSFFWGGSGQFLSRTWPGGGSNPVWLPALLADTAGGREVGTRPMACVSSDKLAAYFCTRWAAGLTANGDSPFLDYRVQIVNEVDPTAVVDALVADGKVAQSDVVMLDAPPADRAWAWKLIANAHEVLGPDGTPLRPRPTPPAAS